MKESMLDVLMYLFENYMSNNCEVHRDHDELIQELEAEGFNLTEIHKAFHWLEDLSELQNKSEAWTKSSYRPALRIFSFDETDKLGVEGTGFILFLEQIGVLNSATRELVIDRAMALDGDEIDLARLKWVILMVLFNFPGQEAELAWMEDYVLDNRKNGLH
ncbi:MAG: DUF494 domain-containing protein [Legionellales bacterium]|nr:DUF494 domain-containing protein [Legionellales bacterium]